MIASTQVAHIGIPTPPPLIGPPQLFHRVSAKCTTRKIGVLFVKRAEIAISQRPRPAARPTGPWASRTRAIRLSNTTESRYAHTSSKQHDTNSYRGSEFYAASPAPVRAGITMCAADYGRQVLKRSLLRNVYLRCRAWRSVHSAPRASVFVAPRPARPMC